MTAVAVWLQFDCCVTAVGWEAVRIGWDWAVTNVLLNIGCY